MKIQQLDVYQLIIQHLKLTRIENILFASFDFPTYLASSLGKIEATTKSQHEKGVYLYII